ncbi:DUF2953 domain-containing protein [Paenibacillus sp. YIM B09110]|uniref:DUF2953 domain-containing protein n=1 Tax=Paenibacillus sp. YIM B09110 TaxID=3126102 RepID=UPI00301CFF3D
MPLYPFGWMTAAGLFFLFIFSIVIASPVKVSGHFAKSGNNDDAEIAIKALFGLYRYRLKVPVIKYLGASIQLKEQVSSTNTGINTWKQFNEEINADDVARTMDRFKNILEMTRNLTGWARQTLTKVKMTEWTWNTSVGTGDAMWTAMTTGFVWSVKTSLIGVLSQMVKLQADPKMTVTPIYQRPYFSTDWSCSAKMSFGNAVLAGMKLFFRMRKRRRQEGGGGSHWTWQKQLFKV